MFEKKLANHKFKSILLHIFNIIADNHDNNQ